MALIPAGTFIMGGDWRDYAATVRCVARDNHKPSLPNSLGSAGFPVCEFWRFSNRQFLGPRNWKVP